MARPLVPPPHPGPPPAPPADELRRLYLDQGLPSERIARHYRTAAPVVRRWLREASIPVRPRTAREHRRRLDIDTVRDLYQEQGWTSAEIAARLSTHVNQVLRTLHDAGVPVRRGGPRPRRRPERPPLSLLASLYADPDIAAALRQHNVTPRDHPGSIAERFPTPFPLTEPLLHALYTELGLSARHIELLTGQPFEQILDALKRPAGGASTASALAWVRQLRPGVLGTIRFTIMATGLDGAVATCPGVSPRATGGPSTEETDFKITPAQPSGRAPAGPLPGGPAGPLSTSPSTPYQWGRVTSA